VGFTEVVDATIPWILLGLAIAAAVAPLLSAQALAGLPAGLDVPIFALLGMPAYICASGATPLVAALVHKGVSPGAAIALLLTGPATNATTFGLLSALHGRRVALRFAGMVALTAVACGYLANAVLGGITFPALAAADHEHSALHLAALGLVGLLTLMSLLRQGPRWFFAQIVAQASTGEQHHDECDDGCSACRHEASPTSCGCSHEHEHEHEHERTHDADHGHEHKHGAH
jgi:hypothetical protein